MAVLLFISLILQVPWLSQTKTTAEASLDIEVVRFSWSHYRGALVVSEQEEKGTGNSATRQSVFRQSIENRNSVENRIQDLRDLEENVNRGKADALPVDTYRYDVEVRNGGTKVIKRIFWDYQSFEPTDPGNISHRQFACAVKIKSKDNESLTGFSALPPRMVVSANKNSKPTEKVIINRVEYADGANWQRADWRLPDELRSRINGRGKCRPI